jgi:hypothetical protein
MIANDIVNLANQYAAAGITEIQPNNGWQPNAKFPTYEQDMVNLTGWYHGAEWCSAQAILTWKKAYAGNAIMLGIINRLVSLNSQAMGNQFHADKYWPTSSNVPQLGTIVIWALGDSLTTGHAGIVTAINGSTFTSVEGNTSLPNAGNEREGWTVASHIHTIGLPHSTFNLNLSRFIYPLESYNPLVISE